jgi:hypothetical protein
MRDFGQISAHQRKVVSFIYLSYGANTGHYVLVSQLATQRITGIGWISDYATGSHDSRRLPYQAQLGVIRMNGKKLSHARNGFWLVF